MTSTLHRGGEEGKYVILTNFCGRGPSVFTRVVDVKWLTYLGFYLLIYVIYIKRYW